MPPDANALLRAMSTAYLRTRQIGPETVLATDAVQALARAWGQWEETQLQQKTMYRMGYVCLHDICTTHRASSTDGYVYVREGVANLQSMYLRALEHPAVRSCRYQECAAQPYLRSLFSCGLCAGLQVLRLEVTLGFVVTCGCDSITHPAREGMEAAGFLPHGLYVGHWHPAVADAEARNRVAMNALLNVMGLPSAHADLLERPRRLTGRAKRRRPVLQGSVALSLQERESARSGGSGGGPLPGVRS